MTKHTCYVFALSLCLIHGNVSAQTNGRDQSAIEYAGTISANDLKDYLSIIASDALEGRNTGERGQKMAAAYLNYFFKENGLEPRVRSRGQQKYVQTFYLNRTSPGDTWLEVNGRKFINFSDLLYTGKENIGEESAEAVFVGSGKTEVLEKLDLNGKSGIAYCEEFYQVRSLGKQWSQNNEGKLIIIFGSEIKQFTAALDSYGDWFKSGSFSIQGAEKNERKGVFVVPSDAAETFFQKDAEYLKKAAEKADDGNLKSIEKLPPVKLRYYASEKVEIVDTENVMGFIEGTDKKEELIVISGHYDHVGVRDGQVYNGSDDNGSGTVAVMELAQAFSIAKKHGHGPRRSMLFLAVSGEEKGLLGSKFYVENPVLPLNQTIADLNLDMLGRVDKEHENNPDYVYLIGSDKLSSELHLISEQANELYTKLELNYKYNDDNDPNRFYYRSDHYSFAKNNIPSIFYFNGTHEDYHKSTDTIDRIDFERLEKRVRLVFHTAWILANREDRIVVDKAMPTN